MKYLTGIPRKPLPEGEVVVHNFKPRDGQRVGEDGFRIWRQDAKDAKADNYVTCDCGWASDRLAEHYVPAGRA